MSTTWRSYSEPAVLWCFRSAEGHTLEAIALPVSGWLHDAPRIS